MRSARCSKLDARIVREHFERCRALRGSALKQRVRTADRDHSCVGCLGGNDRGSRLRYHSIAFGLQIKNRHSDRCELGSHVDVENGAKARTPDGRHNAFDSLKQLRP